MSRPLSQAKEALSKIQDEKRTLPVERTWSMVDQLRDEAAYLEKRANAIAKAIQENGELSREEMKAYQVRLSDEERRIKQYLKDQGMEAEA